VALERMLDDEVGVWDRGRTKHWQFPRL
jgi:hypothetical protein